MSDDRETAFRLMRTVGGVMHVADVALWVEPFDRDEVAVSDEVFGWRRDVYGPDAKSGPDDQGMVAEAVEGVWYVLRRRDGEGRRVTVTRIQNFPVDTGIGDVKFAAVAATCRALGVELDRPPFIEASGVVFRLDGEPPDGAVWRVFPTTSRRRRCLVRGRRRT